MDPKAFLSGAPIPPEQTSARLVVRYYGVYASKRGPRRFLTRSKNEIPSNALVVKETTEPGGEAERLSKKELDDYINDHVLIDGEIMSGDVVYVSDGDRVHTAVALEIGLMESFVLFLTTNPFWNPRCRPITKDEMALTGWPSRDSRPTFLAPVVRPTAHMTKSGNSFPMHRVKALLNEFDRKDAERY